MRFTAITVAPWPFATIADCRLTVAAIAIAAVFTAPAVAPPLAAPAGMVRPATIAIFADQREHRCGAASGRSQRFFVRRHPEHRCVVWGQSDVVVTGTIAIGHQHITAVGLRREPTVVVARILHAAELDGYLIIRPFGGPPSLEEHLRHGHNTRSSHGIVSILWGGRRRRRRSCGRLGRRR